MANRRHRQAALVAALGLAAGSGVPAVWVQAAPQDARPPVTQLAQVGQVTAPVTAQVELFSPQREVPKAEPPSPERDVWRTAVVIVVSALIGLLAGAGAAAGMRGGGRRFFRRDPRETQRMRERDRELQQQDVERRDSAA